MTYHDLVVLRLVVCEAHDIDQLPPSLLRSQSAFSRWTRNQFPTDDTCLGLGVGNLELAELADGFTLGSGSSCRENVEFNVGRWNNKNSIPLSLLICCWRSAFCSFKALVVSRFFRTVGVGAAGVSAAVGSMFWSCVGPVLAELRVGAMRERENEGIISENGKLLQESQRAAGWTIKVNGKV
jgi:hypothetical protein